MYKRQVHETPLIGPSLQQQLAESIYEVAFAEAVDGPALRDAVAALLAAPTLLREKKRTKDGRPQQFDLRPLILALDVTEGAGPLLRLRLVHTATQTGRPDDVLDALGLDPLAARVHRVGLRFTAYEPPLTDEAAAI